MLRIAVFLCNNETMAECHMLQLFGTNEPYGRGVRKGDLCFLYNYSDNSLYGVWEATSDGGTFNAGAWHGRYPHQVRIKQASERIMRVSRAQIQRLLGEADHFGRIYVGDSAQELLGHFAAVYTRAVEAGQAVQQIEEDYRNQFPAQFFCDDGHRVRSQAEKIIDDWLHRHRVQHSYEPLTVVPGRLIPDFVVYSRRGDPICIEYWGMAQNPTYEERRLRKSRIYADHHLALIELYPNHIQIIDAILPPRLTQFDVQFQ